jgi:hypothetical protein
LKEAHQIKEPQDTNSNGVLQKADFFCAGEKTRLSQDQKELVKTPKDKVLTKQGLC